MRPPKRGKEDRTRREREIPTRINERIRVREVLLINEKEENLGVKPTEEALKYAYDLDLDLVEISPQARPPVCRVMDFGKWKYEQNLKAKAARRSRTQIVVKEIKFRPKIGQADYETKRNHVRRFLELGDKVKVTIMFRGREVVHSELGLKILERVATEVADVGTVEQHANLEGRNMTMMLGPTKAPQKKDAEVDTTADVTPEGDEGDAPQE